MLDRHREAASDIQVALARKADLIRNRNGITEAAKLRLLAQAHAEAKTKMNELQESAAADTDNERGRLHREAFGATRTAADALADRDARQRAAQATTPAAAAALLREADMAGDDGLSRAVAAHSFEQFAAGGSLFGRPWGDVVDAYTARHPEADQSVTELAAISGRPPLADFTFVTPLPHELMRLPQGQLDNLANSKDAA